MNESLSFHDGRAILHAGDCLDVLDALPENSIDSVVCDPPYHLTSIVKRFGGKSAAPCKEGTDWLFARSSRGFMGKEWDGGDIAFRPETWAKVLRVLKPGGHLVAFSAPKCSHRMVCAIEDAGFEIRDGLMWMFGTGFPKSHDVSKGIDRLLGAERTRVRHRARPETSGTMAGSSDTRPWIVKSRESGFHEAASDEAASDEAAGWQGWGTALKPAYEPICLARKPLEGTVAGNVLKHGVGAININACRIGEDGGTAGAGAGAGAVVFGDGLNGVFGKPVPGLGRWPANVVHDGSAEVVAAFPETTSGTFSGHRNEPKTKNVLGKFDLQDERGHVGDSGSAARFFYSAKADSQDRIASKHPTVKPVDLMQWLCRLVTPKGGVILDPFAGSGSTGEAALREGFRCILIEREEEYRADIARRLEHAFAGAVSRRHIIAKAKGAKHEDLPLFGGDAGMNDAGGGVSFTGASLGTPNRADRVETVA